VRPERVPREGPYDPPPKGPRALAQALSRSDTSAISVPARLPLTRISAAIAGARAKPGLVGVDHPQQRSAQLGLLVGPGQGGVRARLTVDPDHYDAHGGLLLRAVPHTVAIQNRATSLRQT
jgi:hypothetical protein